MKVYCPFAVMGHRLNCQQERLDVISVWHDFKLSTKENSVYVQKQKKRNLKNALYDE